jgi:hypothetical protein
MFLAYFHLDGVIDKSLPSVCVCFPLPFLLFVYDLRGFYWNKMDNSDFIHLLMKSLKVSDGALLLNTFHVSHKPLRWYY